MPTIIAAVLDRNAIRVDYKHKVPISGSLSPVDLDVRLIHKYKTATGVEKEIELSSTIVDKKYLNESGPAGPVAAEQFCTIHIINPRYYDNLFVKILETRDNLPITTTVSVLIGDDPTVVEAPSNPIGSREFAENVPVEDPKTPENNVFVPEPQIITTLTPGLSNLVLVQASERVYLNQDMSTFETQGYNQRNSRVFVENSIENLLENPVFGDASGVPAIPDKWELISPGLIVSSLFIDGPIEDTNIWHLRVSNTNLFSAFDTFSIKSDKTQFFSGTQFLTASVYYQSISDKGSNLPFDEVKVKISFYDNNEVLLVTYDKTHQAIQSELWNLVDVTAPSIPSIAQYFDIELEVQNINDTTPFSFKLYLPQVETSYFPTSRTLGSRVQDRYTTAPVNITLPLYLSATTFHSTAPGIRGLFDTTVALKDGFQFTTSGNKLYFKLYNAAGIQVINQASATLSSIGDEQVEYGVYIDGSVIEFYENKNLVSSHSVVYSINQPSKSVRVGGLEASNKTINSELLDFGIFKDKPT